MKLIEKTVPRFNLFMYSVAAAQLAKQNNIEEGPLLLAMASAIRNGELKARNPETGAYCTVDAVMDNPSPYVTMQDVNTWLISNGYPYRWDGDSANSTISTCSSSISQENNIFQKMEKLTPQEISITFVGVKSEGGMGNNMLEISARGEKKRVPIAALNLVDGRKGTLDSQGTILWAMTKNNFRLTPANKNSQKMTRLRQNLQAYFGINSDPFHPFNKADGWLPIFKIDDKIGAADERAKLEAEWYSKSRDQMNESGEKASADYYENNEANEDDETAEYDETNENDAAALWIKEKERKSNN